MFYNCYRDNSSSTVKGCESVIDRFTVYMKTTINNNYEIINQIELRKINSRNDWVENNLNLYLNTSIIYVNI